MVDRRPDGVGEMKDATFVCGFVKVVRTKRRPSVGRFGGVRRPAPNPRTRAKLASTTRDPRRIQLFPSSVQLQSHVIRVLHGIESNRGQLFQQLAQSVKFPG